MRTYVSYDDKGRRQCLSIVGSQSVAFTPIKPGAVLQLSVPMSGVEVGDALAVYVHPDLTQSISVSAHVVEAGCVALRIYNQSDLVVGPSYLGTLTVTALRGL